MRLEVDMMDVRIKYWNQDTIESGRWCVSGLMSLDTARKIVEYGLYDRAEIVLDEDGWPPIEDA